MRKSKYDQSSLPVQDSKSIDSDDNISKIENRVDFETELVCSRLSFRAWNLELDFVAGWKYQL